MKRQLIIGLILVVLIGACFGTYFGIDWYQSQKAEESAKEAAALQLSSFNADDVTEIVLHTPDLDYTLDNSSGSWEITEGDSLRVNTYYLTALCTYGCSLTATKDLGTADSEKMEDYGLSDPIAITYTVGGDNSTETTLYIGNQNPTKDSFYVMHDDDDHVYLADADTVGYLYVTKSQLRYRYVVNDTSSTFSKISLQRDGETVYTLEDTDGNADWKLTEPLETPIAVDNSAITNLYNSVSELEAEDFGDSDVTEDKYAAYGFDSPAYRFQFTQENGDVTTLLVPEYDPLTTSYVDCLHVETNEIIVLDSSYLSFLQKDAADYMVSTVYKLGLEEISALTVEYQGSFNDKTVTIHSSYTIDQENTSYVCDGTAVTADDTGLASAFQTFYSALSNLSYESLENTTDTPTDTDPSLHLEYTLLSDGSIHTMDLVKRDDTTYWAFIDGEFTHAIVRQRSLSGEGKLLEAYTELQTALESAAA